MSERRSVNEIIEHQLSPWMRLITPIALGLIMYILSNFNANIQKVSADVSVVKDRVSINGERIKATETAIEIYHSKNQSR